MTKAICAIIKDEHRHLQEWIDYNISIGFDAIHLYEDEGSKSHKEITDKYPCVYLHSFRGSVGDGYDPRKHKQMVMYEHFLNNHHYDWVAFIDPDEFIRFETGYDLDTLINEFSDKNGVFLCWRMINSCGHIEPVESLQKDLYYEEVKVNLWSPLWSCKTLLNVKKGGYHMMDVHKCMGGVFTDGNEFIRKHIYGKAWIDHYFTKSWEEWLERFESRGDVVKGNRKLYEYFLFNPNDKDKCIEYYMKTRGDGIKDNAKVFLMGRTCNQLFEISAALTKNPNAKLYLCGYRLDADTKKILDFNGITYQYWNNDICPTEVEGYCQDASMHDEELLRRTIKLPMPPKTYDFVIHVRREDYLWCGNDKSYYTLTKEYIERMYDKYYKGGSVAIVSTTDGLQWAREQNFKFKYEGVSSTPIQDLSTIVNAKTVICSGSSFSVMGCMLNNNKDKVCVIHTPYDKISDEHDKIIPDYFKKEKLYIW